jgi:hypothetical protein
MEETGGGRGVILTRREQSGTFAPTHYASGSVSGAKPSKNMCRLSITRGGEGAGAMVSDPLIRINSQTAEPFQFPYIVLDGRVAFFYFQTLSPFSLNPRHLSISTLSPFNFQTLSLFYFLPFSLMAAVCLMLLLLDDLITHIIIHSIKDEPAIRFLILYNQIRDTFRRICDSDEVLLHVSLRELHQVCRNCYIRSYFERDFDEANHPEALCFEGMERLMTRRNPDKGL